MYTKLINERLAGTEKSVSDKFYIVATSGRYYNELCNPRWISSDHHSRCTNSIQLRFDYRIERNGTIDHQVSRTSIKLSTKWEKFLPLRSTSKQSTDAASQRTSHALPIAVTVGVIGACLLVVIIVTLRRCHQRRKRHRITEEGGTGQWAGRGRDMDCTINRAGQ